ncbi:hypothetical protein DKX38_018782 [Salix brachista]|uniref:Uncharacterized protein n=1 Tax=Salix brachista TaxID=2182728 RepID=A0A5N5KNY3_9ROSI|nr:hypothetical protein DKX38_018782 [Salix brachista]
MDPFKFLTQHILISFYINIGVVLYSFVQNCIDAKLSQLLSFQIQISRLSMAGKVSSGDYFEGSDLAIDEVLQQDGYQIAHRLGAKLSG